MNEQELALINKYTKRQLTTDELYSFNVTLCDNDIDRDFECFTISALKRLAELFIGKTGIFDHEHKTSNQAARVYDTSVIVDHSKKTKLGEDYTYLQAKSYILKNAKNADLIADIDGGIKKEVSVSCNTKKAVCSICGNSLNSTACTHNKGEIYDKKLCFGVLDSPSDAYEWSFVCVPAQEYAGVTKGFKKEGFCMRNIDALIKSFSNECDVTINSVEATLLKDYIDELLEYAKLGKEYKADLTKSVTKLAFLAGESIDSNVLKAITEKLNITELKAFEASYRQRVEAPNSQLFIAKKNDNINNNQFKI